MAIECNKFVLVLIELSVVVCLTRINICLYDLHAILKKVIEKFREEKAMRCSTSSGRAENIVECAICDRRD
ncbi:hypothetical protein Avbf_09659 [Armadillidium vulgare]|nr:hypothetical protein Avbf_09659 [Armadillidium vulgare]